MLQSIASIGATGVCFALIDTRLCRQNVLETRKTINELTHVTKSAHSQSKPGFFRCTCLAQTLYATGTPASLSNRSYIDVNVFDWVYDHTVILSFSHTKP